jgi:hypothetical protein
MKLPKFVLQNWHQFKAEYEKQHDRKWNGNKNCYCNFCSNNCIEYFDIQPHGLEASVMCIKCAEQIKNAI